MLDIYTSNILQLSYWNDKKKNYSTVRGQYMLVSDISISFPKVWVPTTLEKILTCKTRTHSQIPC